MLTPLKNTEWPKKIIVLVIQEFVNMVWCAYVNTIYKTALVLVPWNNVRPLSEVSMAIGRRKKMYLRHSMK